MEYKEIKQLMDDMGNSKLDSLDIEFPDGIKISMTKNKNKENDYGVLGAGPVSALAETNAFPELGQTQDLPLPYTDNNDKFSLIKSPMVGTFYSRSSPDKEPFVKVGDIVKKGDSLCIVEAMKLMNEIESEYDGEIVEICARDEQMVEYGQTLFKLK